MSVLPKTFAASTSSAYLFLMVALLIGLPLLTAYYFVNPGFYVSVVGPYLGISVIGTLYIIRRSLGNNGRPVSDFIGASPTGGVNSLSGFIAKCNSVSPYLIMGLGSAMVAVFGVMRFMIISYYPYPPPKTADYLGGAYITMLIALSIFGFSRVIYSSFPVLKTILAEKRYAFMAIVMSLSFAFVYLLLVNQLVIAGLNTIGSVASPGNVYPFIHVFTVGVQQPFLNLVYIPYVLVQISPQVNLLIVPFEMIFTVLLSLLVAANVIMAHYLISNSGLRCSTKATFLSTGGSMLGLTATCPTCLVPTFVSVIFGSVVAAEAVYSNIYGVVLPPVLSVLTLVLSIIYLSRMIKKRTNIYAL
ncbi:MAG: hypothetical protein ACYC7D_04710 [Nitrososphaerales archaeon]